MPAVKVPPLTRILNPAFGFAEFVTVNVNGYTWPGTKVVGNPVMATDVAVFLLPWQVPHEVPPLYIPVLSDDMVR